MLLGSISTWGIFFRMNKIGPKLLDSLNDADFGEMFMSAFLTMDKAEASKVKQEQLKGSGWVSMYPSYVDKEMSVKDGRRVRSDCACIPISS